MPVFARNKCSQLLLTHSHTPPAACSARDIRERAAAAEEEKKLTALGLLPPHERSAADVRWVQFFQEG